ncbi:MAG TPA: hypothetical protein DD725_06290 [Deltaproteobacteria bacterium]|nr:hypothetical protein [Deltaproteobacteria bacterium]
MTLAYCHSSVKVGRVVFGNKKDMMPVIKNTTTNGLNSRGAKQEHLSEYLTCISQINTFPKIIKKPMGPKKL